MENKDASSSGKCPVMHGGATTADSANNMAWWPKALNLDIPALVDTLKRGAAGSWQLENRGVTMAEGKFDFGFAIDWAIKDLGIVTDCARGLALDLPLTQETLARYRQISTDGHGREDTSALIRQFDKKSN